MQLVKVTCKRRCKSVKTSLQNCFAKFELVYQCNVSHFWQQKVDVQSDSILASLLHLQACKQHGQVVKHIADGLRVPGILGLVLSQA